MPPLFLEFFMSKFFLKSIENRLSIYNPRQLLLKLPKAAVLIPIVEKQEPSLLLTLRAAHMRDHPNQVAFPGGKFEEGDKDLFATGLRESFEEIGLNPSSVQLIAPLSQLISLHGLKVSPFVVKIPDGLNLSPQTEEISEIFEVPLSFFEKDSRAWTDVINFGKFNLFVPSYNFEKFRIWGLSAMMIVEFLQIGLEQKISLAQFPHGSILKGFLKKPALKRDLLNKII